MKHFKGWVAVLCLLLANAASFSQAQSFLRYSGEKMDQELAVLARGLVVREYPKFTREWRKAWQKGGEFTLVVSEKPSRILYFFAMRNNKPYRLYMFDAGRSIIGSGGYMELFPLTQTYPPDILNGSVVNWLRQMYKKDVTNTDYLESYGAHKAFNGDALYMKSKLRFYHISGGKITPMKPPPGDYMEKGLPMP